MARTSWFARVFAALYPTESPRRKIPLVRLTAQQVLALRVSGPAVRRLRRVRAGLAELRYRWLRPRYRVPGSAYFVRREGLQAAVPTAPQTLRAYDPPVSRRAFFVRRIRLMEDQARLLTERLRDSEDLTDQERRRLNLLGAELRELVASGMKARSRLLARPKPEADDLRDLAALSQQMEGLLEKEKQARERIRVLVKESRAAEDVRNRVEGLQKALEEMGEEEIAQRTELLEKAKSLLERLERTDLDEEQVRQLDLFGESMRAMIRNEMVHRKRLRRSAEPLIERLEASKLSPAELGELVALGERADALAARELIARKRIADGMPVSLAIPPPVESGSAAAASIEQRALEMLDLNEGGGSPLGLSSFEIEDATYYDFPHYEFLVDPYRVRGLNCNPLFDLEQLLEAARTIFWYAVISHFPRTTHFGDYQTLNVETMLQLFTHRMEELFVEYIAESLYDYYVKLFPPYAGYSGDKWLDVTEALSDFAVETAQRGYDPEDLSSSFDSLGYWTQGFVRIHQIFQEKHPGANVSLDVQDLPAELPFTPFPEDEVNFGLRILYRQKWVRLGTQPGELVRTIPLGPKQTEKVTTKSLIRNKFARNIEALTATETLRETSTSSKDSSEVVEEASEAFNIHADASASGTFGFGSASATAGTSYDTALNSKNAKTRLNEAMAKTSSKMRRETKVVVSTEREATDEFTTSSEITNPNEEIAVTYVYSKLQRQYQITTTMAEVESVVFVPMCMPSVGRIDEGWIKDHAWILARALLDSSFADDLALIATTPPLAPPADPDGPDNKLGLAMDSAIEGMKGYQAFQGNLPDVFRVAQEKYDRRLDQRTNYDQDTLRRTMALARLQKHIVSNILHYMKTIWRHEDHDQRIQRLAQVMVPVHWEFVPHGAPTEEATIAPWQGTFVPDESPGALFRLTDLIDPGGPLDYVGNYAVYRVKGSPAVLDLNRPLSMLRSKYAYFEVEVDTSAAPGSEILQAVALEPRFARAHYTLLVAAVDDWTVAREGAGGIFHVIPQANPPAVEFEGILIQFDQLPSLGSSVTVKLRVTQRAEDPELRFLKASVSLPVDDAEAASVFNSATLVDMLEWLPALSDSLPADLSGGWPALGAAARKRVRETYHEYLLLRDNSTRLLVDTNNLLLDLEVGKTPALEQYKRLSRLIDVLKLLEEYVTQHVENRRRSLRLGSTNYADPEVDNLSVFAASNEIQDLIRGLTGTNNL